MLIITVTFIKFDLLLPTTLPAAETLVKGLNISESGFKSGPIDIFVRQVCKDQWKWLEDAFTTDGVYCVEGAPGVGKSVITYWCAMAMADWTAKGLIYIHATKAIFSLVVYSVSERIYKFAKFNSRNFEDFKLWLSNSQFDILIVDGAASEALIELALTFYDGTPRSIIFCTSFQALNLSAENHYDMNLRTFVVTSWTKEDYARAGDAGLYMDNFDEMYFYGGSSIRYILWNKDKLIAYLNKNIKSVRNAEMLLSGFVGDRAKDAVNSLMCILDNEESIFLSEYVTRKLSRKCETGTINLCKSILTENPSWQGWVADLEVLSMIRKTKRLEVWTDHGTIEIWTGEIAEFTQLEELENRNFSSDMFLLPKQWNQSAFDFLYKPLGNRLQVGNITIGEKHSFNPKYIHYAARYCGATDIDFAFLCRKRNFKDFTVPSYRGGICVRKVSYEQLDDERNA